MAARGTGSIRVTSMEDYMEGIREGYQSRTLTKNNTERFKYLPVYPTKSDSTNQDILLANIPRNRLTSDERALRRDEAYTPESLQLMCRYNDDAEYSISREDRQALSERLRIGTSIVTFNADRLRSICLYFLQLHEDYRKHTLLKSKVSPEEPTLNSNLMTIALEFFLQMDVDIFFMKTCSFRGAEPRSSMEGLFCGDEEPKERYEMSPCSEQSCLCCYPLNYEKRRYRWPVVDFESTSKHKFCNDYTSYLNAPATCETVNIIYVMTCACGGHDYIDSTDRTLSEAITYHRDRGNRIMHYYLTGSPLNEGDEPIISQVESDFVKSMRLYQHSARCRAALLTFLSCNPHYWCFIPQPWNDSMMVNFDCIGEPTNRGSEVDHLVESGVIEHHEVAQYLHRVPLPPAQFIFSYQQRQEQRMFFRNLVTGTYEPIPFAPLDLHQFKMIAVLPNIRSRLLRYIIETLFIVHGETGLNMICPLGSNPERRYGRGYYLDWCRDVYSEAIALNATTDPSVSTMMTSL